MCDELIKRLREEAGEWCANCCYKCGDNVCGAPDDRKKDCDVYTKLHAADSIEEQQVIIRAQKAVLDQAPHWIPSEDCLPVNGEEVITLGVLDGLECGFYLGLCGTKRDKWKWKKHTVRTVKYWMPRKALPEPPKEG